MTRKNIEGYDDLVEALSTATYQAHVERSTDGKGRIRFDFWWTSDDMPGGGLLDIQRPDAVGEATVVLREDGGAEWTRLLVQNGAMGPDARGQGILRACMGLSEELNRKHGLWPTYISLAATDAPFYMTCGFEVDEEHPGFMVKDQERAEAWARHG